MIAHKEIHQVLTSMELMMMEARFACSQLAICSLKIDSNGNISMFRTIWDSMNI